ncbi:hypothetical protein ALMP_84470 [Streptomyces sp. A012304]|nr:hypothetical protein ALMP_84470 [Streptomyces sp. A012304]
MTGAVHDIGSGEKMFTGWVVGPRSYLVHAPLRTSVARTVVHEGKPVATPDAGRFWRVAAERRVTTEAVHRVPVGR